MKLFIAALLSSSAVAWTPQNPDAAASTRREVISKTLMAGATLAAPAISNAYELADLPYPFEALEPYIDAPTMKIHHDKHHATYVANINKATEGKDEVPILDLMADALEAGPGVRNSGGGHYNHAFFWDLMTSPDAAKKTTVSDQLQKLVDSSFGSMDEMKAKSKPKQLPELFSVLDGFGSVSTKLVISWRSLVPPTKITLS